MALIRPHHGALPHIPDSVFIAETAVVIGEVSVGERSSIWFGCVVRGDVFPIRIGADCNIQDCTVIHVTTGKHATTIGDRVTVGHRALLHGCTVMDSSLIGMGAIVMDGAVIEPNCLVAAGSVVTPGTVIPAGHLAVGSPARPVRALRGGEIEHIEESAIHYVELATSYIAATQAK